MEVSEIELEYREAVPLAETQTALREELISKMLTYSEVEETGLWGQSDTALDWVRAFAPTTARKDRLHALADLVANTGPKYVPATLLRYAETAAAFPPDQRPEAQGLTHRHFVTAWTYGKEESCHAFMQALLDHLDETGEMLSVREFENLIHGRPLDAGKKRVVLDLSGEYAVDDTGIITVGGEPLVNALADAGVFPGTVVGSVWSTFPDAGGEA